MSKKSHILKTVLATSAITLLSTQLNTSFANVAIPNNMATGWNAHFIAKIPEFPHWNGGSGANGNIDVGDSIQLNNPNVTIEADRVMNVLAIDINNQTGTTLNLLSFAGMSLGSVEDTGGNNNMAINLGHDNVLTLTGTAQGEGNNVAIDTYTGIGNIILGDLAGTFGGTLKIDTESGNGIRLDKNIDAETVAHGDIAVHTNVVFNGVIGGNLAIDKLKVEDNKSATLNANATFDTTGIELDGMNGELTLGNMTLTGNNGAEIYGASNPGDGLIKISNGKTVTLDIPIAAVGNAVGKIIIEDNAEAILKYSATLNNANAVVLGDDATLTLDSTDRALVLDTNGGMQNIMSNNSGKGRIKVLGANGVTINANIDNNPIGQLELGPNSLAHITKDLKLDGTHFAGNTGIKLDANSELHIPDGINLTDTISATHIDGSNKDNGRLIFSGNSIVKMSIGNTNPIELIHIADKKTLEFEGSSIAAIGNVIKAKEIKLDFQGVGPESVIKFSKTPQMLTASLNSSTAKKGQIHFHDEDHIIKDSKIGVDSNNTIGMIRVNDSKTLTVDNSELYIEDIYLSADGNVNTLVLQNNSLISSKISGFGGNGGIIHIGVGGATINKNIEASNGNGISEVNITDNTTLKFGGTIIDVSTGANKKVNFAANSKLHITDLNDSKAVTIDASAIIPANDGDGHIVFDPVSADAHLVLDAKIATAVKHLGLISTTQKTLITLQETGGVNGIYINKIDLANTDSTLKLNTDGQSYKFNLVHDNNTGKLEIAQNTILLDGTTISSNVNQLSNIIFSSDTTLTIEGALDIYANNDIIANNPNEGSLVFSSGVAHIIDTQIGTEVVNLKALTLDQNNTNVTLQKAAWFSDDITLNDQTILQVQSNLNAHKVVGNAPGEGILRFTNQNPVLVKTKAAAGNAIDQIEITEADVEFQTDGVGIVAPANGIHFSNAAKQSTLIIDYDLADTDITTDGNLIHNIAVSANQNISGSIGSNDHALSNIQILGDHLVSVVGAGNFYTGFSTANSKHGTINFDRVGMNVDHLGSKDKLFKNINFNKDISIKADVYSLNAIVAAGQKATFGKSAFIDNDLQLADAGSRAEFINLDNNDIHVPNITTMTPNEGIIDVHGSKLKHTMIHNIGNILNKINTININEGKHRLDGNLYAKNINFNKDSITHLSDNRTVSGDVNVTNTTIDLDTKTLKFIDSLVKMQGDVTIMLRHDGSDHGQIISSKDSNIDLSQVDSYTINLTGSTNLPVGTTIKWINTDENGAIIPLADISKIKIINNAFNTWKVDNSNEISDISNTTTPASLSTFFGAENTSSSNEAQLDTPGSTIKKALTDTGNNNISSPNQQTVYLDNQSITPITLTVETFDPELVVQEILEATNTDVNLAPLITETVKNIVHHESNGQAKAFGNELARLAELVQNPDNDIEPEKFVEAIIRIVKTPQDIVNTDKGHINAHKEQSNSIIQTRMNSISYANIDTLITADYGVAAGANAIKHGIWFIPFYGISNQKELNESPALKSKVRGIALGWDTMITDNTTIGAAVNLNQSKVKHQGVKSGDTTKYDSAFFALYTETLLTNKLFIQSIGGIGSSKITKRAHRIGGDAKYQIAESDYNIDSLAFEMSTGYKFTINSSSNMPLFVTPVVGLSYSRSEGVHYQEIGTTNQNLSIDKERFNKYESIANIQFATITNLYDVSVKPEIHTGFRYDLRGKNPEVIIQLEGMQQPIIGDTSKPVRESYNVGGGITLSKGILEMSVIYDSYLAKKYTSHKGSIKLHLNL